MKKIIIFFFVIMSANSFAGESQIKFNSDGQEKEFPKNFWYGALSHHYLDYSVPSLMNGTSDFNNQMVGVTIGRKYGNNLFKKNGFVEYSGEWQNYKRTSTGVYSQQLNLLKLNIYQNFLILKMFKKSLHFSAGGGISPTLIMINQSTLSNSSTDLGILFAGKTNFTYPINKKLISGMSFFALDLETALSFGEIGGHQLMMTSIKIGSSFAW